VRSLHGYYYYCVHTPEDRSLLHTMIIEVIKQPRLEVPNNESNTDEAPSTSAPSLPRLARNPTSRLESVHSPRYRPLVARRFFAKQAAKALVTLLEILLASCPLLLVGAAAGVLLYITIETSRWVFSDYV
jgi:hypothetical protein